MSKPWDREGGYGRREATRFIRDRFLIVCEGAQTEPNYFREFPVQTDLVELDVAGVGANTLSLVEEAIRQKGKAARNGKPYNQVWCVFDRDVFPAANFNAAFRLANANGVRTAYSNQCFELWYFLHFNFNDAALHRHAYGKKLTGLIGKKYEKNDTDMYAWRDDHRRDSVGESLLRSTGDRRSFSGRSFLRGAGQSAVGEADGMTCRPS